jgi:anti-sigma B factor antagonist
MAAPFTLRQETQHGAHVLHAAGKITLGESSVVLRDTVRTLVEGGARQIVLDLSGVSSIDSAGLGELVASYTAVTSRGGKLALASVPKRVADLLEITKLNTVFPIYESTALAATALTLPATP